MTTDEKYMKEAIRQAKKAAAGGKTTGGRKMESDMGGYFIR